MSSWNREGPSMVFLPRLPTLPGCGFTSTGLPCASNIASRLHATFTVLVVFTTSAWGQGGSLLSTGVGNPDGPFPPVGGAPPALGSEPMMFGVFPPAFCQMVFNPPAVIVSGAPVVQRMI